MLKKELYIHIGTGKTGTTAIQKIVEQYESSIAKNLGIKYAKIGRIDSKHRLLDLNARRNDIFAKKKILKLFRDLKKEANYSNFSKFLISDEDFPGLSTNEMQFYLNNLSDVFDIKIVMYLRRQDEFVESWNNQLIKTGNYKSNIHNLFKNLKNKGLLNYYDFAMRWADVFGKENIIIRTYEPSRFQSGLINDFLSIFGSSFQIDMVNKNINKGLTNKKIRILKLLDANGVKITKEFVNNLISLDMGYDSKYLLSLEQRQDMCQQFDEQNNKLALEFLGRSKLFESNIAAESEVDDQIPYSTLEIVNRLLDNSGQISFSTLEEFVQKSYKNND